MREYQGTGIITISDMPVIKGNFKLRFEDNGKSALLFEPEDQKDGLRFTVMPTVSGKFTGLSNNPYYEVEIGTVYLVNVHFKGEIGKPIELRLTFKILSPIKISYIPLNPNDRIEFRCGLSNLLFWGTQIIQQGKSNVFGKTTWQLAGITVVLERLPNYEDVSKHLKEFKDVGVTCELKINGYYKELPTFGEISENLQSLFSLASANYITSLYEDVYINRH